MQQVELVTVLELPLGIDAGGIRAPASRPWWEHREEWEAYWQALCSAVGIDGSLPVPGSGLIADWSKQALAKIVADHLDPFTKGELDEDQICALFGGFLLSLDGEPCVFPQCCSTIAALSSWSDIAEDGFEQGWISEGHPSPGVFAQGESVLLVCEDDDEAFGPPCEREIRVDRRGLLKAIAKAESDVLRLAEDVQALSTEYGIPNLARRLVWEDEDGRVHGLAR